MDSNLTLNSENTIPSTPPPAVFSDDANRPSSPRSSPPGFPWDYDNAAKAIPQAAKASVFSVLGKRKALSTVSDNARPNKKRAIATKKSENGALTQMQISLGQEVQKRCKTCGMEYVVSSAEDRKMHDKYHKQNTEGYDVGKDFARNVREGAVFEGTKKGDMIHMVDSNDKLGRRTKAQALLDIVQKELGAAEIDNGIWDGAKGSIEEPQFRSYLYLRGTKCVGYLLVERIHEAREVVAPEDRHCMATGLDHVREGKAGNASAALKRRRLSAIEEQRLAEATPIELSKVRKRALLGISRIWTSSSHRRQNIATCLLDAALQNHTSCNKADKISSGDNAQRQANASSESAARGKDLVAFSQPTDSGAKLARRWFGRIYGWKVHVD